MKRIRKCALLLLPLAVLGSLFVACPGCEDEPDDGDLDQYFEDHPYVSDPRHSGTRIVVTISPAFTNVVDIGDQILFTASGGRLPYTWVVLGGSGTLERRGNYQALYTAAAVAPRTILVHDANGDAAIATIGGSPLTIQPSGTNIVNQGDAAGGTQTFNVYGGSGGYLWVVSDQTKGTLNTDSGSTVQYTGNTNDVTGINIITVYDSKNNQVKSYVEQK
ncbi:MAG: hypothetical protein QME60_06635 [Verrucomicrobiota bacterium]|nr:hypothetical protein [Verrucomicrobiota bacterium]